MGKKKLLIPIGAALISYTASAQVTPQQPASQKESFQSQKDAISKQESLSKEQIAMAKTQQEVMQALKSELLKDKLIEKGKEFEFLINNKELIIDGKTQEASAHQKYLRIINSKIKKPLGEKDEWRIKE